MIKIGVDIDGVLADFTVAARDVCKKLFNGRPDDSLVQTGWGFDSLGMSSEEENLMWKAIDKSEDWWMNLKKLPDTYMLEQLMDTGKYRIVFITNRKDGTGNPVDYQSSEWLSEKFNLRHANVILSDDKGPVVKGLKLDYYIDDRDKNVLEVLQAAPNCKTYMCKWPWKPSFQSGFPNTVNNFNEFAKILLET